MINRVFFHTHRRAFWLFLGLVAVNLLAWGWALAAFRHNAALIAAALLLAESFGWDVVWLWRRRPTRMNRTAGRAVPPGKALDRSR